MPPRPVGPPPGLFDDEPVNPTPNDGESMSTRIFWIGITVACIIVLGFRSCSDDGGGT